MWRIAPQAHWPGVSDQCTGRSQGGVEVPVEKPYSGSSLIEQKWFRHVLSGQVWRLVYPDPPLEGVFEPVASEDKRRE